MFSWSYKIENKHPEENEDKEMQSIAAIRLLQFSISSPSRVGVINLVIQAKAHFWPE